jgi:hypothetical protein
MSIQRRLGLRSKPWPCRGDAACSTRRRTRRLAAQDVSPEMARCCRPGRRRKVVSYPEDTGCDANIVGRQHEADLTRHEPTAVPRHGAPPLLNDATRTPTASGSVRRITTVISSIEDISDSRLEQSPPGWVISRTGHDSLTLSGIISTSSYLFKRRHCEARRQRLQMPGQLSMSRISCVDGAAWASCQPRHIGLDQLKLMSAIESCRTAALGGHVALS